VFLAITTVVFLVLGVNELVKAATGG